MRPKPRSRLITAAAAAAMGVALRVSGLAGQPAPLPRAALLGAAVVGAAFLLTWAAEAAQLDVSPTLAIAGLALVAMLPEYAVGTAFAWRGGHAVSAFGRACQSPGARAAGHDSACTLALANMLGANRLLVGLGWSGVVLVAWWRHRRRHATLLTGVTMRRAHSVELSYLLVATLWCLSLPLRRSVGLLDTVALAAVFVAYAARVARSAGGEPTLEGVGAWLAARQPPTRRRAAVGLALSAAVAIGLCAQPFADALVGSGARLGLDEFFLVQWVAPLASEAPELVVAGIYAWRLTAGVGLAALVSSKLNQWTLLVATLPVAFALADGSTRGLPLPTAQRQELALTAAQSMLGVAMLGNLEVSTAEAIVLCGLFLAEFSGTALTTGHQRAAVRALFSITYLVAAAAILVIKRRDTVALVRDGFRTPYAELGEHR